jgi:hypothetical protein
MMNIFKATKKIAGIILSAHENMKVFFLAPASARPLGVLRIGVCLVLLAQAFALKNDILEFCSEAGYLQGPLADYLSVANTPQIASLYEYLHKAFGVSEFSTIIAICLTYVVSLIFVATGLFTRPFAILAWISHWTITSTSLATTYGVDLFANVFLFYFMFVPIGDALSIDVVRRKIPPRASWQARLGLRVLQIHLCIAYLASGIEKGTGIQWWTGEVLSRVSQLPVYQAIDLSWVHQAPLIAMVAGWGTLLIEVGYCFFIWPKKTRMIWVLSIFSMHLGIIAFMGLHLFGAFMAVLTPALFAFSAEPKPEEYGELGHTASDQNFQGALVAVR